MTHSLSLRRGVRAAETLPGGVTRTRRDFLERTADVVTWRDFGYQTDDDPFDPADIVDGVGPFHFARMDYDAALQTFRDEFDANPGDPEDPPRIEP